MSSPIVIVSSILVFRTITVSSTSFTSTPSLSRGLIACLIKSIAVPPPPPPEVLVVLSALSGLSPPKLFKNELAHASAVSPYPYMAPMSSNTHFRDLPCQRDKFKPPLKWSLGSLLQGQSAL